MGTFVCSASKGSSRPIQVSLRINGKPLVLQLGTGVAVSLMGESTFPQAVRLVRFWPDNFFVTEATSNSLSD